MPLNFVYRNLGNFLSPAGEHARLSILIYHRVLPEIDPLAPSEVNTTRFDKHLSLLKNNFNVLPLSEAVSRLKAGTLPARAAAITFDDGYADNYTLALPILRKHELTATFFIATAYLDGGRMFNDTVIESIRRSSLQHLDLNELKIGRFDISCAQRKRDAIGQILPIIKYLPIQKRSETAALIHRIAGSPHLPDNMMMTRAQLQKLHQAGMEIGSHTTNHPILATLDEQGVRQEIGSNKQELESLLNTQIRLFAYPNGKPGTDYLPQQASIVQSLGFDAAVSTAWGASRKDSDAYQLPRFTPWHTSSRRFVPMLLGNLR